jgi:periplasmic mercuric ion binding protein
MKKLSAVFVVVIFMLTVAFQSNAQELKESKNKVELKVSGMTCAGCNSNLSQVLSKVDGVIEQDVAYPGDIAVVTYDPKKTSPKDLVATIHEQTSYTAEVKTKSDKKNKD